jgi:hypothetical protein
MAEEIKIKYKLKAKDGSIYITQSYTLEEIENCSYVENMIWQKESKCYCLLSENNPSCICGGYLGDWNDEVEFEIVERILDNK